MARLRATASAARSVLDGREHDGTLKCVGSRADHQKSRTECHQKACSCSHLWRGVELDRWRCLMASEEITNRCRIPLEPVERCRTILKRDRLKRRQLPARVFFDHQLACRHPISVTI